MFAAIENTKTVARKIAFRTSLGINAIVLLSIGAAFLGIHTGHVRAEVEFPTFTVGGGTTQHQAEAQQLERLAAALPMEAQVHRAEQDPLPGRKPVVR